MKCKYCKQEIIWKQINDRWKAHTISHRPHLCTKLPWRLEEKKERREELKALRELRNS